MSSRTVCVIGLGYIGLPTAVALAHGGHRVIGIDVSEERIALVSRGQLPFVEPGLEEALHEVVSRGALSAQRHPPRADVYIIAVPTPYTQGHRADVSFVEAAGREIAPHLADGNLVILESTCPPGTTRRLAEVILAERPDLSLEGTDGRAPIHVAHAPERVLPGRIMVELVANDRVIGGLTPQSGILARELYSSFCEGTLLLTDATTAEMTKLTENAFRDVNIAFANELSLVCAHLGIDVWELIELANHHPRVNILQPGPGVGGHCIAVDPWFIVSAAPSAAQLIRAARAVNDSKPAHVVQQIRRAVNPIDRPVIAVLGLAYKADIDDLRESPAVTIVASVAEELPHSQILAVEPHVSALPPALDAADNVELVDIDQAVREADVVVLLVNHAAFHPITLGDLAGKEIVDTCGAWRSPRAS